MIKVNTWIFWDPLLKWLRFPKNNLIKFFSKQIKEELFMCSVLVRKSLELLGLISSISFPEEEDLLSKLKTSLLVRILETEDWETFSCKRQ